MSYVDLNPVRAGVCRRLEDAEFTSIEERLREASRRMDGGARAAEGEGTAPLSLMPFAEQAADADAPSLPMLFADYVELVEWTGRSVVRGRAPLRGAPPSAMQQLGAEPEAWLRAMSLQGLASFGALGTAAQLEALAARQHKRWVRGQRMARRLFARAA